ncbi:hypothetical protein A8C32_18170 [Flavivirga aquatica]|uniref:Uncharacterized protein n=1 Tax=Flavivirga aquatica TaxID=1849968 RepID=A0A1E5T7L0_9FLAO|nr:hypothetical protein [Flavivirga aquatica]OEK07363.1 hypothetical protein A8C32_18170 [Flavivirga aquatica]
MEYKTPKVLEKKPVIAGFDLKTIVVISACFLLFLFTVFASFFLSLSFILIAAIYIKIQKKYPERGELSILIKYTTSVKCIEVNQPIISLIKTK